MALLTTAEAARRCGVCPRTLLRWLACGEVQGLQTPGGHWRVDESALTTFLRGGAQRAPRSNAPLRVAIIEDEPTEAQALARLIALFAPSAQVERAADGLSAGLLLGAALPDLAFVDIEMPNLDGINVIRQARRIRSLVATQFVVLSGKLTPARIEALEDLGVSDILAKPVSPQTIRSILLATAASKERAHAETETHATNARVST